MTTYTLISMLHSDTGQTRVARTYRVSGDGRYGYVTYLDDRGESRQVYERLGRRGATLMSTRADLGRDIHWHAARARYDLRKAGD